ncbi:hypothetical protein E3983_13345 [Legionella israelensis]|uniref:YqaE/Pmp3 family membrane protein n=1 Tax=Legionella israelensis TaxID=454 RepID=A0AAX1EK24_9GAMM|nr:hypothetical protein [Legionella israelensis]QBR85432.1 hypothetical protein E3983_13345 [Legionella israelensis]QBS11112.1 hypothetical protein E4T55_08235 [Legionella israelensis]
MRLLKSILAIFIPWLTLLIHDNPGGAIVALIMQATIIGWPFASAWALRVEREERQKKPKPGKKENK